MTALLDLACVLRTKNAGPFQLTIDLFFPDAETYRRVVAADIVTVDGVATLYGADPRHVTVHRFDTVMALKVTLDRPSVSGSVGDRRLRRTAACPVARSRDSRRLNVTGRPEGSGAGIADRPELVFNRDNNRACHQRAPSDQEPEITARPDFVKQYTRPGVAVVEFKGEHDIATQRLTSEAC